MNLQLAFATLQAFGAYCESNGILLTDAAYTVIQMGICKTQTTPNIRVFLKDVKGGMHEFIINHRQVWQETNLPIIPVDNDRQDLETAQLLVMEAEMLPPKEYNPIWDEK